MEKELGLHLRGEINSQLQNSELDTSELDSLGEGNAQQEIFYQLSSSQLVSQGKKGKKRKH